jgi:S1-C subfamily serine protease
MLEPVKDLSDDLFSIAQDPVELSPREHAKTIGPAVIKVGTPGGLGSGVIIDDQGYAITNAHVIQGEAALRATVWFPQPDGTLKRTVIEDIEILAVNNHLDLALIKIAHPEDKPFIYATVEPRDMVEVGQPVFAIGNPLGLERTLTQGVVSTRNRGFDGLSYIQTDTPINPGNSGGALIDTRGRLIGVNTSILSRLGGSNGIGFAIPASLVAQFLKQAADGNRSFTRPWAGAGGQAADADVSELLGLSAIGGVVITALHPMSPLKVAGIKVGDVVTAVAGQLVYTPAEMLYRMSLAGIGNTVQMRVVQGGVTRRYALGLIAPPETPARAARTLGDKDILSGVSVLQINPAVIVELGLPLNSAGVVVTDAGPLGPRIGLQRMDVLVSVNSRPVETTKDVARLLRRAGRRIELVARRGARQILLRFRL